ncbi:MAG TPA: inorganic diphosphatase, partial [Verrucomicrobiales bacterium]|nr:inorganic diphosphatase [Verrucomicrobiales bacterium]
VTDTLNLTSPTTTKRDAEILTWLEGISGVNATKFTEELFSIGSVLVSQPPERAITADCKEYVEDGRRFSVAQIEELGFTTFWKQAQEVQAALERHRRNNDLIFSVLFITDVVRQKSLMLVAGPKPFVDGIAYPEVSPGVFEMEGVVSRKKQLLPYLMSQLRGLGTQPGEGI